VASISFQTILAAVDDSDVSENAFVAAKTLAKALSAKLIVVHVLDPHSKRSPQPIYGYFGSEGFPIDEDVIKKYEREWANFVNYHEQILKQKVDEAIADGIEASFLQPSGSPGAALCEVAKVNSASLMVVGTHQRRGMAEIMLGSTSNYITHHAPCSVMVVYTEGTGESPTLETNNTTADRGVVAV
jgi:nucleotide-binding universal stress UspA family protein